jgi:uncharacterized protein
VTQPPKLALETILESLNGDSTTSASDAQVGSHWTAVVSRRCGLASTPHREHCSPDASCPLPERSEIVGRPALALGQWSMSETDDVRRAVGMAAINSLIEPDLSRCREMNARDLLLQHAPGHSVAMIGHFPFTDDLRAAAKELWVLELHPRAGDLPADQADQILPQADVVGITGVTLINGSFDALARLCRPDAFVVMLGGTTPLTPVLFDYGVDAIAGTIVEDAGLVMQGIAAGATFRQLRGKRPVLMLR